jgi:hypothetical protein
MRRSWWEEERGSAPLEMVLGIGLILIPLALISLSFGPLLQRIVFTRIAAAEAARELVLSDGSESAVLALVRQMAINHGLAMGGVEVGFCDGVTGPITSAPRSACGPPVKGQIVTVLITTRSPAFVTPYGGVGRVTIRAAHTEMVGLYRSTR